jgi:hypothetical protein
MTYSSLIRGLIWTLSIATLWSCSQKSTTPPELLDGEQLSYNFHIRPILSDKCFSCHGPDANKREANLRLDTEAGAFAALKESPGKFALVAGKPLSSEVYHRITSSDPGFVMPPPTSNLSLTDIEVQLITRWIEQGAAYEPHWAFTRVEKPKVPSTGWGNNEIDRFVGAKLESKGLEPNPEASSFELIKRASLDLTGLPPSLELLEKYAGFKGKNTYDKLLDQLLNSPSYGEKMAILWLDISRYSDSYGYQDDNIRSQWPYRDWVIHAFNKNLPYDQFLTWQLAGDLLPNPTKEQILATAFNRNHK